MDTGRPRRVTASTKRAGRPRAGGYQQSSRSGSKLSVKDIPQDGLPGRKTRQSLRPRGRVDRDGDVTVGSPGPRGGRRGSAGRCHTPREKMTRRSQNCGNGKGVASGILFASTGPRAGKSWNPTKAEATAEERYSEPDELGRTPWDSISWSSASGKPRD
ncbi:hypothetical protein VTK56DRAFT_9033 [Thermocarpiscus australiensis]